MRKAPIGILLAALAAGCGSATSNGAGLHQDGGTNTTNPDASSCVPKSCAELGVDCGAQPDGCGGVIECGTCTAPEFCGGGGPSRCGTGACVKQTCAALGASCGQQADGCGGVIDCGTCTAPQTCGGSGTPNVCGAPKCTPETCADLGFNCGQAADGCGGVIDCGACTAPQTCGGSGTPNVCAGGSQCVKKTCADFPAGTCGQQSDGCGGLITCATCTAPQTCGGGGSPNVCGTSCVKKTCADFPAGTCGQQSDGCGGLLSCGTCTAPQTCGGGGTPNVCGTPTCTPKTCADLSYDCGQAADGCGNLLDCGTCTSPETCGGGGTPNVCGTPQTTCLTGDSSWSHSQSFAAQTGTFTASFDATPGQNSMDGVMGLSQGPAAAYTDLASIVRFNSGGTIDARDGANYTANASVPYTAGSTYHFRLVVDLSQHTYSTYVTPPGGSEVALGSGYAFRTEQASVTSLDHVDAYAGTGSETLCNFSTQGSSCTPLTACPAPDNCGTISNGCGGTLSCGSCTSPETCGGGGTLNVCGQSTCVPKTCADFPAGTCGQQPDGCGGLTASCGTCATTSIIASSRRVDWSIAGVQGGIPNRTTTCATLNPGVTASQINSAIASCPSGEVVYLNAGTYNLSGGISLGKSGVTLRGAGPDKTFLVFTGGGTGSCGRSANVCVGTSVSWSSPPNLTSWTGGYSQGSTQVTLSSVNNLKVGGIIIFDQLDDSSDTGNIYFGTAYDTGGSQGGRVDRPGRSEVQVSVVQAINGNTVTIAPGVYMPQWRASQAPQAYWPSNTVTGAGVEDLSIDNTNSSAGSAVAFGGALNSWETNVRSLNTQRNHVWLWYAAHITVSDSYFYGTKNGTTSEYGIEVDAGSASLFTNNIFQHVFEPYTLGQASGDVFAYTYTTDNWYSTAPDWMRAGLFTHDDGTSMDLFEGNQTSGLQADNVWGAKNMNTLFRNRLLGWDDAWGSPTSGYSNTIPVNIESYARYYNVIGNVLGMPGFHTNYADLATSGTSSKSLADRSIYVLGWTGETGGGSADPVAISTLMRWGNYDTATGAAHWTASEVPSGLSLYANPVPSSHSLPASFYLSSRPGWWTTPWGTPPWPAIGPDVTGGTGPGGHSYDIPAKLCYDHTAKDSNGVLKFNAANCYGT